MLGIAVGKYENIGHNTLKRTFNIMLNYKTTSIVLALILIFTFWHYASLEILYKGSMLIEEDNNKALEYIELGNKIYPINSIGYKLESDLYYQKYLDDKKIEYLDKAVERGKKSIELTPYKWDLHNHLGKLFLEKEDYIKAEVEFLLAVDYSAYSITPYLELSNLYNYMNDVNKEKEVLYSALKTSEFSLYKAKKENKLIIKMQVASIHNRLSKIFEKENDYELSNFHSKEEEKLLIEIFQSTQ
jgi:tetratricopeptide (TPR) repeat protein